jgi:hypothetical protein
MRVEAGYAAATAALAVFLLALLRRPTRYS